MKGKFVNLGMILVGVVGLLSGCVGAGPGPRPGPGPLAPLFGPEMGGLWGFVGVLVVGYLLWRLLKVSLSSSDERAQMEEILRRLDVLERELQTLKEQHDGQG